MATAFDSSAAPKEEPENIVAGDFVQWKRTDLTEFDNSLFTLSYSLKRAGAAEADVTFNATADGSYFLVQLPSATTAAWTAGTYYWQAYITRDSDSERIAISRGVVDVLKDFATDTTDPRGHARTMLDKIRSVIENRADSDVQFYMIAGRQISKMPVSELIEWESHYRARVAEEEAAYDREHGKPSRSSFQIKFGRRT